MILRKITKTGATRCQILRLKCTKFDFRWGSVPDPDGGAYSAPPDALAEFKGPTSKGREGRGIEEGKGRRREREREGSGVEGREGLPPPPNWRVWDLGPPLISVTVYSGSICQMLTVFLNSLMTLDNALHREIQKYATKKFLS